MVCVGIRDVRGYRLIGFVFFFVIGYLFWIVVGCGVGVLDGFRVSFREDDGVFCVRIRDVWFGGRRLWR